MRYYDSKIGWYWKETDRNTEIEKRGSGKSDMGAYATFGLAVGSRLNDVIGLYAEFNKRIGFVDSWGGMLGVAIYFSRLF